MKSRKECKELLKRVSTIMCSNYTVNGSERSLNKPCDDFTKGSEYDGYIFRTHPKKEDGSPNKPLYGVMLYEHPTETDNWGPLCIGLLESGDLVIVAIPDVWNEYISYCDSVPEENYYKLMNEISSVKAHMCSSKLSVAIEDIARIGWIGNYITKEVKEVYKIINVYDCGTYIGKFIKPYSEEGYFEIVREVSNCYYGKTHLASLLIVLSKDGICDSEVLGEEQLEFLTTRKEEIINQAFDDFPNLNRSVMNPDFVHQIYCTALTQTYLYAVLRLHEILGDVDYEFLVEKAYQAVEHHDSYADVDRKINASVWN